MNSPFLAAKPLNPPSALRSVGAAMRSTGRLLARHERGLSIAGLLLAQVLVALLYFVLVDNQARVGRERDAARQQALQRHRCTMEMERLNRESCLVGLAAQR